MTADPERETSRIRRQAVAMNMLHKLRPGLLHEFKGPLQAILSAVYLLERKHDAGSTASTSAAPDPHVALIRKSVQQLLAFVEALLTDGAGGRGARESVDLAVISGRALHLLRDRAALLDVSLEYAAHSAPDTCVQASREDLELALTVLLVCSLDRAPPRAKLCASIAAEGRSLRWTANVVPDAQAADTAVPRIASRPEGDPGDALALEVAREILAAHGAELVAEDAPDGRQSLTFALPVVHEGRSGT
jgi:K+-sensing histidine kinase KdpD